MKKKTWSKVTQWKFRQGVSPRSRPLPRTIKRIRRELKGAEHGDRLMGAIPSAVLTDGHTQRFGIVETSARAGASRTVPGTGLPPPQNGRQKSTLRRCTAAKASAHRLRGSSSTREEWPFCRPIRGPSSLSIDNQGASREVTGSQNE